MSEKTTIYSLAQELNMTPSMVSRAFTPSARIDPEKRRLVLEAAERHGYRPNRAASRLSGEEIRIAVIISSAAVHVNDLLLRGIREAAAQRADCKVIPVIRVIPADTPHAERVRQCEAAVDASMDSRGAILTGFSDDALRPSVRRLRERMPVVFLQDKLENEDCLFASCHDERTAARMACELLDLSLRCAPPEKRRVLLFTGDRSIWLHRNADAAFRAACAEYGLELVDSMEMHDSDDCLRSLLDDAVLQRADTLGGIYITSGNCLELCRFIKAHRLPLSLITFDVYDRLNAYVRDGTVQVTMCQNLVKQAKNAYLGLCDYLISGQKPDPVVLSEVLPVMRSNLHLFE